MWALAKSQAHGTVVVESDEIYRRID